MSQSIFTRCPECSTVFRVTEEHLALAKGKVRCGACMNVFTATEHLVRPKSSSSATDSSSSIERSLDKALGTSIEEHQPSDDGLLRASNEAEQEIRWGDKPENRTEYPIDRFGQPTADQAPDIEESGESNESSEQPINEFSDSSSHEEPFDQQDFVSPMQDDLHAPESFEEPDLEERIVGEQSAEKHKEQLDPSDDDIESFAIDAFEDEVSSDNLPYQNDSQASDELTSDATDGSYTEGSLSSSDEVDYSDADETDLDDESAGFSDQAQSISEDDSTSSRSDAVKDQEALNDSIRSEHPTLNDDFSIDRLSDALAEEDLEPDPLDEFDDIVERKSHALKWMVISIVLVGGLGFFIYWLWSDRQTLAWDDTWGSSVQVLCSVAPCDLKPRRNVAAIELLQRDIRPSENNPEITEFNLFIRNNADYEQPYPTVEIRFTDTKGAIVSSEIHSPEDYLSADVKGRMMPVNQRTLILIQARKSNANAFGFEFNFK